MWYEKGWAQMFRFLATGLVLVLLAPIGNAQRTASRPIFKFQNNFWVNLHHFVRAESRRQMVEMPLVLPVSALRDEEKDRWKAALDTYTELAKASLIFSERLVAINNALATVGETETLADGTIESAIVEALNAAAPVYRVHLWDQHRRENEEWIARFGPKIQKHAPSITEALADAYQVSWPEETILVDLSCESGPNNAYTTGGPPETAGHAVIAPSKTSDPDDAFELAFHEASHTVDSHIIEMVAEEGARQQVKPPTDFWHMLLFYTTGEVVKQELSRHDQEYQPYAYRRDMYSTADRQKIRTALEQHWQPYLEGKAAFKTALHDLVRDASQ